LICQKNNGVSLASAMGFSYRQL